MKIEFREIDPFNCWIWINFFDVPSDGVKDYINGVIDSWYVLGRLGGFNAENLQVHNEGNDISWMNYESELDTNLPALMHNVGHLEYNGSWGRFWVDFGTSDQFSIDILINCLSQFSKDVSELECIIIGGVNDDWDVDKDHPDYIFNES